MAMLRCACGNGSDIWGELWWVGGRHRWVYFDDENQSETYSEMIDNCPRCGTRLERENLTLLHPVR